MNSDVMKYFRTIGKITKIVSSNNGLDAVLRESIHAISEDVPSDYALVWFYDEGCVKPYYWVGDRDFTGKSNKIGEGIVGRAFEMQTTLRAIDASELSEEEVARDFGNLKVASMLCIPFSNKMDNLGCIQFVRAAGKPLYTEEEADICEIFANVIALQIDENPNIAKEERFEKRILSARGIEKSYQNGEFITHVLKGVNIDVYEGELLVVLGESGCGKSTFLNIIGGMESCDSGDFAFMGSSLAKANKHELTMYRRKNIGFIFQSYNLMPNLTAVQNLDLIAELVDDPMDSCEALEMVGLLDKKDCYPAQLSGGQQQRVSIARALVKRPKIIFADEPTAALDYATGIEVLSVLENVVKSGTTVVMVTHNEEITKMADRVVRMRSGKNFETTVNKYPLHATDLVW